MSLDSSIRNQQVYMPIEQLGDPPTLLPTFPTLKIYIED